MAASPHACSQFPWDLTVEADGGGLYRASHWEGKKRPGARAIIGQVLFGPIMALAWGQFNKTFYK